MVFSIFSRKEKADGRKNRLGAPPRAPDSTLSGPNTPDFAQSQRELARKTTEKIDQIESEMITAGLPVPPPPKHVQAQPPRAPSEVAATQPANPASMDFSTSVVLGDTAGAGEIHVNGSNLPPELEEAAILFANGQPQPAAATLRHAIAKGELGGSAQQAWLMLFDVYHGAGMKGEFESLAIDYAARFEQPPPPWRDRVRQLAPVGRPAGSGAQVVLPSHLDGSASKQVEHMQRAATSKRPVTVDVGGVRHVDAAGAALLLAAINDFKRNQRELVLINSARLFDAARASVEPGRRDESEAGWMLALEMLRVQGLKQQFDDLSIDYCVTFEVSPPSWEPMPEWIRNTTTPEGSIAPNSTVIASEPGTFALQGEITGRMQKELAALRAYAHERTEVTVDCRDLTRLDFVAAGELLNEVVTLRGGGKALLFVEPNYVVLALMLVMGIHELADIRRHSLT